MTDDAITSSTRRRHLREALGMIRLRQTWVPNFGIIVKSLQNPENAIIAHIWVLECQRAFESTKETLPALDLSNP